MICTYQSIDIILTSNNYVLDSKKFGSVSLYLCFQDGLVSVFGKKCDRSTKVSRTIRPTLNNFYRMPNHLMAEMEKRIQNGDMSEEGMSSELRKFCNMVWRKASEHNAIYGRK